MIRNTRRQLIAGGVATAAAAAVGHDSAYAAPAHDTGKHALVVAAPGLVSLPVIGSGSRFPVRRIYCVGRNYAAHVRELDNNPDEPPFFFQKQRDMIVESGGKVRYPQLTSQFEFETELVVAMKSGGMNIPAAQANRHVFGYAVGFDMTRRDRQAEMKKMQKPWEIAKSFEQSAPCGAITPAETTGHISAGEIKLLVNGQTRQSSDLSHMIWGVPQIVAQLSREAEIRAGDLIYTGTPEGVGPVVRGDHMVGAIVGLSPLVIDIV